MLTDEIGGVEVAKSGVEVARPGIPIRSLLWISRITSGQGKIELFEGKSKTLI